MSRGRGAEDEWRGRGGAVASHGDNAVSAWRVGSMNGGGDPGGDDVGRGVVERDEEGGGGADGGARGDPGTRRAKAVSATVAPAGEENSSTRAVGPRAAKL